MTGAEERSFFFQSCQNIKWVQVLQECLQGWGHSRVDLFLSALCMWESICVFIYIFVHVFPPNPNCFHTCFSCTAEEHAQQFVLAPLCSFAVVENWSKSKWLLCYLGEAGGYPKQDQMQGSRQLLGLIEGGSVAPVEPLTGFTEAWQTGIFPFCTPYNTMNTTVSAYKMILWARYTFWKAIKTHKSNTCTSFLIL